MQLLKSVFILTDLEGASHVTRFAQTREEGPAKIEVMELLTKEVNAVIKGISQFDPTIKIHAWDGHGSGGLVAEKLTPIAGFLPHKYHNMISYFRVVAAGGGVCPIKPKRPKSTTKSAEYSPLPGSQASAA